VALAPVFDVPLGELTHLLVRGEYVRRTFSDDPGLPLTAASLSVPSPRFVGEPGEDVIAEGGGAQLELTHFPEGDIQLRQSLRYLAGSTRGRRVQLTGLTGSGLVTRQSREASTRTQALASQSELLAQVHMGRFEHALITGFEYTNGASAGESSVDSLASIALAAPLQGAQPVALGARQGYRAPSHSIAAYAQDHIRLHARLRLLMSGRWQRHTLERSTAADAGALTGVTQSSYETTAQASTGRAGLVFQPIPRGRVFVLAGHAFEPSTAFSERGDVPGVLRTTGTQYELGWKQESASGRFAWTASTYTHTQRHVRALRPTGTTGPYSWRIGEQKSTGFEFDATGAIGNDLRVTLGYAYTDARITDPGETNAVSGTRLPMVPRHHTTWWAVYRVPSGRLAGLDLGAGLVAQSERSSALVGGPVLPGFNELELMLGYGRQRWQAQLDVRNVTDTQAYDAMPGESLMPREPRGVRGSLLVRF
jgi:iron complex outermembrane receptor protein